MIFVLFLYCIFTFGYALVFKVWLKRVHFRLTDPSQSLTKNSTSTTLHANSVSFEENVCCATIVPLFSILTVWIHLLKISQKGIGSVHIVWWVNFSLSRKIVFYNLLAKQNYLVLVILSFTGVLKYHYASNIFSRNMEALIQIF